MQSSKTISQFCDDFPAGFPANLAVPLTMALATGRPWDWSAKQI
jgi:hypothetical protein